MKDVPTSRPRSRWKRFLSSTASFATSTTAYSYSSATTIRLARRCQGRAIRPLFGNDGGQLPCWSTTPIMHLRRRTSVVIDEQVSREESRDSRVEEKRRKQGVETGLRRSPVDLYERSLGREKGKVRVGATADNGRIGALHRIYPEVSQGLRNRIRYPPWRSRCSQRVNDRGKKDGWRHYLKREKKSDMKQLRK